MRVISASQSNSTHNLFVHTSNFDKTDGFMKHAQLGRAITPAAEANVYYAYKAKSILLYSESLLPIRPASIPKWTDGARRKKAVRPEIHVEKENNEKEVKLSAIAKKRRDYFTYIPFTSQSTRERVYTFIDLDHMKCGGTDISQSNKSGVIHSIKYGNINDLRAVLRGINPNVNSMAQKNISMLLGIKMKKWGSKS